MFGGIEVNTARLFYKYSTEHLRCMQSQGRLHCHCPWPRIALAFRSALPCGGYLWHPHPPHVCTAASHCSKYYFLRVNLLQLLFLHVRLVVLNHGMRTMVGMMLSNVLRG